MLTWSGPIALEGTMTGDSRMIEVGALQFLDEPVPLRYVHEDVGEHQGAVTVGQILTVERQSGGIIFGTGTLDDSFDEGAHAAKLVRDKTQRGISIDPDSVKVEYRTTDGGEVTEDTPYDDVVMVMTEARLRGATLVSIPAFAEAMIELDEVQDESDEDKEPAEAAMARLRSRWDSVVAAGVVSPPAAHFEDPKFTGPTKIRVDGDRLLGHLAVWGTQHIGFGERMNPPRSMVDYAYFRTGTVITAEGTEVHTGTITMDAPHAGKKLRGRSAAAHYDNTGTGVADVCIGEDRFGIWISGSLRPGTTDEQIRTLRASALSGDWRRLGGNLELVAALAVNVPGFPVIESSLTASGEMESLVATGFVFSTGPEPEPQPTGPSKGVLAGAAGIAARIGRDPESRKAELIRRVKG